MNTTESIKAVQTLVKADFTF